MTKDEANAVLAMKVDDLLAYDLVDANKFENLESQRDDAISRIDAYDAEKAALAKANTDALAAKDATHASAVATLNTTHADAIASLVAEKAVLVTAHVEALAAKDTEKVAELSTLNASHATQVATLAAEKTALASAHAVALADKDTKLAEAQALIDALGSTELGQKLQRQKQREELARQIVSAEQAKIDAEAKLAEIPVDA